MSRPVVVLVAFLAFSSVAFASQPGQPLDCSDWVFAVPGLGNTPRSVPIAVLNARAVFDSTGHVLRVRPCNVDHPLCVGVCSGSLMLSSSQGDQETLLACLPSRNGSVPGSTDYAAEDVVNPQDHGGYCGKCGVYYSAEGGSCVGFDQATGFLFLSFLAKGAYPPYDDCHSPNGPSGPYRPVVQRCAIGGFAPLNEVLQTYAPATSSIGFRVPYMPEGMAAADHFDTHWGTVTRPLDFSQAHPLQCAYPDHQPTVGEFLTFPDAAPTPSPGQAVYYLTSVTYQGQTRAGRQAIDGTLHGRDATSLPTCISEK